jgi:transcriptional regulator with XRE-family HTH domain
MCGPSGLQPDLVKGPDSTTYFWKKLDALREARGLTKKAVADLLGKATQDVQRWKNGTVPGFETVELAAQKFGVGLGFFSDVAPDVPGQFVSAQLVRSYLRTARGASTPGEVVLEMLTSPASLLRSGVSADDALHALREALQSSMFPGTLEASGVQRRWAAALERNFAAYGLPEPQVVRELYSMEHSPPVDQINDIDAHAMAARARYERGGSARPSPPKTKARGR